MSVALFLQVVVKRQLNWRPPGQLTVLLPQILQESFILLKIPKDFFRILKICFMTDIAQRL